MSVTKIRYGDEWITMSGIDEIEVDDAMSSSSENPIQNKIVKQYVDSSLANHEPVVAQFIDWEGDE